MSISKAQAKAIADGFLDSIGLDKKEFRPLGVYTELILLAGELIEDAQDNLNHEDLVSTGNLSESLVADEPVLDNGVIRIDVYMNFYGQFHNKGVKGTRSGRSTAGFSFRNEVVSKKMYKAISDWIRRSGKSTSIVHKQKGTEKGYGKHEIRRKQIAQYDSAYATARAIKMHGLKPTGFLDKAVAKTGQKISERLSSAFAIDVIDGLR